MKNIAFILSPDCSQWIQLEQGMGTGIYEVVQGRFQQRFLAKRNVRYGVISVRATETSWKLLFHRGHACHWWVEG
jgi:hypothetical protein